MTAHRPGPVDAWLAPDAQDRARPLSQTLRLAWAAARAAGVTRLADVSGLAPFDVPIFQAVRPGARLLSVSQGKGLTPMAAQVSALLEAVEHDRAERLPPPAYLFAPAELGAETLRLWCAAPRNPLGIRLDPAVRRGWLRAVNLASGDEAWVPWDLLSLDLARPLPADIRPASVGLATGNSPAEARVAAVGELLEHEFQAAMRNWEAGQLRAVELDLATIDEPLVQRLLRRIRRGGYAVRAWSMAQEAGIAAFRCAITDVATAGNILPPAGGTACHPNRTIAFVRALVEAVQSRVTLIAGARDDLSPEDYPGGEQLTLDLIIGAMSFGPGPLAWSAVPHLESSDPARQLEALLAVAAARTPLPILVYDHGSPVPGLSIVHALGPGLGDLGRAPVLSAQQSPARRSTPAIARSGKGRPVLFVGPSLPPHRIPAGLDVRPPAVCGDLAALLDDPPPAVGLIDGCFETAPTVWHKEILDLIAHGIPVAGGASLGALRAAELHSLGMIGIGRIFEAYRDVEISRDDAVMLIHAPTELGCRPLTVALVDAEAALRTADIPAQERRQLQRIVRTVDFRERDWDECLRRYRRRTGREPTLAAEQLACLGTIKEQDALALAGRLAAGLAPPSLCARPPQTALYRLMLERQVRSRPAVPPPADAHAPPA